MNYALLDGLVEGGNCLPENQLRAGLVAFGQGLTQLRSALRRREVLARLRTLRVSV